MDAKLITTMLKMNDVGQHIAIPKNNSHLLPPEYGITYHGCQYRSIVTPSANHLIMTFGITKLIVTDGRWHDDYRVIFYYDTIAGTHWEEVTAGDILAYCEQIITERAKAQLQE